KQEIKDNEKQMEEFDDDESMQGFFSENNQVLQYQLDHDINPYQTTGWDFMSDAAALIMIISLFTVIIASDIVAGEFSWGTIKMLMVRPHPRWKILLSKYISSLIFALVLGVFLFVMTWLIGGLFFGFGGLDFANYSMGEQGEIVKSIASIETLKQYGLHMLTVVMV